MDGKDVGGLVNTVVDLFCSSVVLSGSVVGGGVSVKDNTIVQ